ncbi:MAG: hypothetical protein ACRES3_09905 [Steroidobacteraceae bacterium]
MQGKLVLAVLSVIAYWLISLLAETLDSYEGLPDASLWFQLLIGVVFGALVMSPYVRSRQRISRVTAICIASAAIYYLTIRFVTDGPLGYDTIAPFLVSGSGAALFTGLAVVALAPRPFSWKLILLTVAAGAAGGAVFELKLPVDEMLLAGHAAWQLLLCLALHFSFRHAPT